MNAEQRRQEVFHAAYSIPGECWPTEMGWLYQSLQSHDCHIEIGSFCGRSLFVTAAAMQSGRLIAVDPVSQIGESPIPGWTFVEPFWGWTREQLRLTIRAIEWRFPKVKAEHWDMTSVEAARKAAAEKISFDSCYIDAIHHYAEVRADIEMWLPMVREGGLICGHDYWPKDEGVMKAVEEVFEGQAKVNDHTRIWSYRKAAAM